jgi:hypothetical protein
MSSVAQSPAKHNTRERNRAMLLKALTAGCYVTHYSEYGAFSHIPSKSDPQTIYKVCSTLTDTGAKMEHCTCPAMQGPAEDSYTRSIVTWSDPAGALHTNGVLPCSHILIDRFTRWWYDHTEVDQLALVEQTTGLADALAQNGHYQTIPF